MAESTRLLVGTKKGAWIFTSGPARRKWNISAPICFGQSVNHIIADPRAPKRLIAAAKAGHLGPTVFLSQDNGRKWKEASKPPAFPPAAEGGAKLSVDHVFYLTPGHASEPGVWYAGTSPAGLFRSQDHGDTWESVAGFNANPMRAEWTKLESPPEGQRLHSILVDPRDPAHLYFGISLGGVFESTDRGASWSPLNKGCVADYIPGPPPDYGHDPHCIRLHPRNPDRLYQQNHCGIYRIDRPSSEWSRIGLKMPKKIGDIGFAIVLHPRDPDTAWVCPMDGTAVWPRTSVGGKPALYVTRNGGRSWTRQDKGLPSANAWLTVFRQAMTIDSGKPAGIYFGTSSGEVWASRNEGESWAQIAAHLPRIQSVEAG
ncbi:MAG: glycosyl hydrolase [Acidobacteria bacterium]|nr:glycosyl hydrolase [Acidobacteriota bacterium]